MKLTVPIYLVVMVLALPSVCAAASSVVSVPEPSSALLLLLGAGGAAGYRKLRRFRS